MTNEQQHCAYCGLPVVGKAAGRGEEQPAYCCFGCRFAAGVAQERGVQGQVRWTLIRLGIAVFFTMNVMVFTLALWTPNVYAVGDSPAAHALYDIFRYLCLIFSLPVLFLLGAPLAESVAADLRCRRVTTDFLLMLGVAASFIYSAVTVIHGVGHVYFEVVCMVLVATTLGRWLEAVGKLKATATLNSLADYMPEETRRVNGDQEERVRVESIQVGDILRVLPGERIVADGRIVRNQAAIDQQAVTGECDPVAKGVGDDVFAGTLNLDGDLQIEVRAPVNESEFAQTIRAVTAAADASPLSRHADLLARWFLPIVFLLALGTFGYHWSQVDLEQALLAGLSVILIACPCALALATPLAVWAAFGAALRSGILILDGDAFSRMARAKTICFDKTGTLTTGDVAVVGIRRAPAETEREVLEVSRSLSASSTHTMARAVQDYTRGRVGIQAIESPHTVAGRGIEARLNHTGQLAQLGSETWMRELGVEFPEPLQEVAKNSAREGLSLTCVAWGGKVRGVWLAEEALRDDLQGAIEELKNDGYQLVVLTGDHGHKAAWLASQTGLAVVADLLPSQKVAEIEQLRKSAIVVMVGDGINDVPALATADVGIAMGCGMAVARQAADVCLLTNDLTRLPEICHLAGDLVRTIRWNVGWAAAYNLFGLTLAVAGWLNPIYAAAAMVISSLLVINHSLRLANQGAEAPSVQNDAVTHDTGHLTANQSPHAFVPANTGRSW